MVTYDQKTITPLVVQWMVQDARTQECPLWMIGVSQYYIGGIPRADCHCRLFHLEYWTNRVGYLTPC